MSNNERNPPTRIWGIAPLVLAAPEVPDVVKRYDERTARGNLRPAAAAHLAEPNRTASCLVQFHRFGHDWIM
jgi:hypothetical protein